MSRLGPASLHVTIHARSDGNATFTNQPAADTFLFSSTRHICLIDIYLMRQVKFKVNKQGTAANTGATLTLKYSPVWSTTTSDYIDLCASPLSVAIDTTNTYLDTGWVDILADCMGCEEIYLAVIGTGGNGVLDPQFGVISASFV